MLAMSTSPTSPSAEEDHEHKEEKEEYNKSTTSTKTTATRDAISRFEDSRYSEKVGELRRAFALFDRDGTGSIDREELEECLASVGIRPTPAEMDVLYTSMDTDGNGRIDFAEFIHAMVGNFQEQEMEEELMHIRDMFALVDTDGSGRLSPEELQNAIRSLGVNVEYDVCEYLFREMAVENPGLGVSFDEFAMFLLQGEDDDTDV